ncbi:hypothetical protein OG985_45165 [Streptomyces sp. NBC_00289]|uniref:hypothetical protein n=1 Tax=Streptomyces sp. NBC_00289 TaxID=2975703 RepID=UPI003249B126
MRTLIPRATRFAVAAAVLSGAALSLGGQAHASSAVAAQLQVAPETGWGYVNTSGMFRFDSGSAYLSAPASQSGSSSGSVQVRRDNGPAHKFTVRLSGMGTSENKNMPGVVHVTRGLHQIGSPAGSLTADGHCTPSTPQSIDGDLLVDVKCYNQSDQYDMNATFTLTYAQGSGIEGTGSRTMMRVDSPPTSTQSVTPPLQGSTTGKVATVSGTGTAGSYLVHLPVLSGPSALAVTATLDSGFDKSCSLGSTSLVGSPAWQEVQVKCTRTSTGQPVNSAFSVTDVAQTNFAGSYYRLSAAHAQVPLIPVSDNLTSPAIRYNRIYGSDSGGVFVQHAASGRYNVLLANQQWSDTKTNAATVMVTPQKSTASCVVDDTHYDSGSNYQTAVIDCRNNKGEHTDSAFHLTYMAKQ